MTTGSVLVKARSDRPRKKSERQRIVRTVKDNTQTTSKDLQCHLAADGVTVHRSTIQRTLHREKLYGRVMRKKLLLHCGLMKQRLGYLVITRGVMHGGKRTQHSKKS